MNESFNLVIILKSYNFQLVYQIKGIYILFSGLSCNRNVMFDGSLLKFNQTSGNNFEESFIMSPIPNFQINSSVYQSMCFVWLFDIDFPYNLISN